MTFSAVLLVGGESRRMGADKACLRVAGVPLWERQLALLRELYVESIYVSAREPVSWLPNDVNLLLDHVSSLGPLSGLSAALEAMTTTHLIVLAIDLPAMTSVFLTRLCHLCRPGCGAIALVEDRAEPLAAVYPREAKSELTAAISRKEFALQPIIRALLDSKLMLPITIRAHDARLFRNLNEPSDVLAFEMERAQEDSNLRPSD